MFADRQIVIILQMDVVDENTNTSRTNGRNFKFLFANFQNGQRNFESAYLNSNEIIIYEILGIQFLIELIIKITFKF